MAQIAEYIDLDAWTRSPTPLPQLHHSWWLFPRSCVPAFKKESTILRIALVWLLLLKSVATAFGSSDVHVHRDQRRYRVEFHEIHGRLLAIDSVSDGRLESVYKGPGIRVVAHRGGFELGRPENPIEITLAPK